MEQRYARLVKSAALAATVLASSLLLIKIVAWYHTGSVSLLAALVDSLVDIAASLTNLLVVRYSLQPADAEHTFGHGKAESLAALAQSMFISGSALFLFLTGFQHLYAPQTLRDPGVGVVVTVIALISTLILVTYQRWVVRKTRSQGGARRYAALSVRCHDEWCYSYRSWAKLVRLPAGGRAVRAGHRRLHPV